MRGIRRLASSKKIPSYKYISFVDSDDTLDQEFLSILVSTMEQTSADVSVCGYSKIYDDGSIKEIPKSSHKTIIETIDFLKLIFSTKEWLGDRAAGGMVWKNLYRASTVKGLRFNPDREVLEDEPYQLLVAQRASTYAVVKRSLYHYRQRSSNDALCKQDNFIRRQIAGRKECLEYGRKISEKAWLLCLASYVSSLIIPLKSKPDDSIALDSYREDMKKAKKLGYINTKYYILFLLFTRHPLISGLYRKIRDFSMKIR